eukprot:SAG31_NODE_4568_length_3129_cov_3.067987_2_plen_428_part_00
MELMGDCREYGSSTHSVGRKSSDLRSAKGSAFAASRRARATDRVLWCFQRRRHGRPWPRVRRATMLSANGTVIVRLPLVLLLLPGLILQVPAPVSAEEGEISVGIPPPSPPSPPSPPPSPPCDCGAAFPCMHEDGSCLAYAFDQDTADALNQGSRCAEGSLDCSAPVCVAAACLENGGFDTDCCAVASSAACTAGYSLVSGDVCFEGINFVAQESCCVPTDTQAAEWSSCADIRISLGPEASDGIYTIVAGHEAVAVYCDMTSGAWTRVVNLLGSTEQSAFVGVQHGLGVVDGTPGGTSSSHKLSDEQINQVVGEGHTAEFGLRCGSSWFGIRREVGGWTSLSDQRGWAIDADNDGVYECSVLPENGHIFGNFEMCPDGHLSKITQLCYGCPRPTAPTRALTGAMGTHKRAHLWNFYFYECATSSST